MPRRTYSKRGPKKFDAEATAVINRNGYTYEELVKLLGETVASMDSQNKKAVRVGQADAMLADRLQSKAQAMARSTLVRGKTHVLAKNITEFFRAKLRQTHYPLTLRQILDEAA